MSLKGKKFEGIFEGRRNRIIVIEKEIIKNIMVRDLKKFVDKKKIRIRENK
jgi:hypothetical protein